MKFKTINYQLILKLLMSKHALWLREMNKKTASIFRNSFYIIYKAFTVVITKGQTQY